MFLRIFQRRLGCNLSFHIIYIKIIGLFCLRCLHNRYLVLIINRCEAGHIYQLIVLVNCR